MPYQQILSLYLLQSLLNAWSFDVPSDRIEGFQLKGSRLNSLNLRSTVTTMQSTALDLKPAKPGAVNWLTTDLSVIFDSKDKQQQQQQQQRGREQRQFADANKQDQYSSNPRSPTSSSSSIKNNGVEGSSPPSTTTTLMGIGGNGSVATNTSMAATGTTKSSPPLSAAATATATATGSMASTSGEILSGLVARSGLVLVPLEETASTLGTQGNGISPTMPSDGMLLPAGVTSGGNSGLGRDTYVFGLLTLEKGQMMNELCERFYKKYPYEGNNMTYSLILPEYPFYYHCTMNNYLMYFRDDSNRHRNHPHNSYRYTIY